MQQGCVFPVQVGWGECAPVQSPQPARRRRRCLLPSRLPFSALDFTLPRETASVFSSQFSPQSVS